MSDNTIHTLDTLNLTKEVYSDSKPKFRKIKKKIKKK
jgi:hypothetical protein